MKLVDNKSNITNINAFEVRGTRIRVQVDKNQSSSLQEIVSHIYTLRLD